MTILKSWSETLRTKYGIYLSNSKIVIDLIPRVILKEEDMVADVRSLSRL